jgi:hypothetical protein
MPDLARVIQVLRREQAAIAGFGSFALRLSDHLTMLTEAARICAEGVPFYGILLFRANEDHLLIAAGYGWHECRRGRCFRADKRSPQGQLSARDNRRSARWQRFPTTALLC